MRCLRDKDSNFSVIVQIDLLKEVRDQLNTWVISDLGKIIRVRESMGENEDEADWWQQPDSKSESSSKKQKNKKPLSSENTLKLLKCKYQIMESSLKIIDSALSSLEISAEYAWKIKDQLRTQQYEMDL